jgi:hypothetical protein
LKAKPAFYLLLLTTGAFLVHGYHPYAEDAALYLPAVKKLLNPALYPHGAEFFESHGSLTFFPNLIAGIVRVLHMPLDAVLLATHLLCIFLFLAGAWKVSCLCFEEPAAQWCAVALVAALLTMPVAGTALFLMDQYVNPRSLSTFAATFAVAWALERRYLAASVCLLAAGLVHPLMPVYGMFFVLLLAWNRSREPNSEAACALAVFGISLEPPTEAYHQAALRHAYHYVNQWPWYGWVGILGPVGVFYWFGRIARERRMANVERLCRSLIPFVLISLLGALLLDMPRRFEALARLQPLRTLHLTYVLLVLLMGGMAGRLVLKRSVIRWLVLFAPLCAGMAYVQFQLFPHTEHIEWPGVASRNGWVQAFNWIRQNTPADAYFALDPMHMEKSGEDEHAFRAIAERSMLADEVKDSGAVSMFPPLAEEWWEQVSALKNWKSFQPADFQRLKRRYGVNWVVVEHPGVTGMDCLYQNPQVQVCRVE